MTDEHPKRPAQWRSRSLMGEQREAGHPRAFQTRSVTSIVVLRPAE